LNRKQSSVTWRSTPKRSLLLEEAERSVHNDLQEEHDISSAGLNGGGSLANILIETLPGVYSGLEQYLTQ